MQKGISVYAGLGYTVQENLNLIEFASSLGMKYLFTSAQIPEASDSENFFEELLAILTAATNKKFEIILDVSSEDAPLFNVEELTLRLDDGFDTPRIAQLSHTRKIQLNASTITEDFLTELKNSNANFVNVTALHNFYPRRGTGLSEDFLLQKTLLLHKAGIRVGAFVPGKNRKHSLRASGYTTLENHRDEDTSLAARHLVALGIDMVFMGNLPDKEELSALAGLSDQAVTIRAQWQTDNPVERGHLAHVFTARQDVAQNAVRAVEGKSLLQKSGLHIMPQKPRQRPLGAITIDNDNNLPYTGEVEICRIAQAADDGVNVVAQIDVKECNLIEYISPGRKFSFIFHD